MKAGQGNTHYCGTAKPVVPICLKVTTKNLCLIFSYKSHVRLYVAGFFHSFFNANLSAACVTVQYNVQYLILLFSFILLLCKRRQPFSRCRTYSAKFILGLNIAVFWTVTPCNLIGLRTEVLRLSWRDDGSWIVGDAASQPRDALQTPGCLKRRRNSRM